MTISITKLRRRKSKYQQIMMSDFGITMAESPTKAIMICNAGLVNGIDREMIFEKFSTYGSIDNLVMIPGKSCSFLSYRDVESASSALDDLNHKELWPGMKGPVFLAYVDEIPQNSYVPVDFSEKPPGLYILEDFISEDEEALILSCASFESVHDEEATKSSFLKNRRVSHFGFEFKYSNNNVDINEPIKDIPRELDFLWNRFSKLTQKLGLTFGFRPDQLTVNNYKPGQGIPPHVDTHSAFEDPIVSLSLQSSVVMEFRNSSGKCLSVCLPARSLCIMSGDSRYGWTHGIATRKSDIVPSGLGGLTLQFRKERTSFTFRKLKDRGCSCSFPMFCDIQKDLSSGKVFSENDPLNSTSVKDFAAKLEESYVHEVYEKISDHFSETRHKPWPNVVKFTKSFPVGSVLVDVGCGNGKYFSLDSKCFEVGCDASHALMEVCRQRGFECFSCNCLQIPIRDGVADGCLSIAVIHHLVTEERRKKAIAEIIRVLKPKGRALIYVWAKNQERQNKKSSYLKQNKRMEPEVIVNENKNILLGDTDTELTLPVHMNRTNFVHNDVLVPWKLKPKDRDEDKHPIYLRFYHVFEDDELKKLCSDVPEVTILDYYYDQGNWCIILEKM